MANGNGDDKKVETKNNQRIANVVNKANNDKNVMDNAKPTEYHHGTGTATLSASGKVLHFKQNGAHVKYEQDPKKIAQYVAQREAAAKKKEEQDFAREVQKANPTQKDIDARQYEPKYTGITKQLGSTVNNPSYVAKQKELEAEKNK